MAQRAVFPMHDRRREARTGGLLFGYPLCDVIIFMLTTILHSRHDKNLLFANKKKNRKTVLAKQVNARRFQSHAFTALGF